MKAPRTPIVVKNDAGLVVVNLDYGAQVDLIDETVNKVIEWFKDPTPETLRESQAVSKKALNNTLRLPDDCDVYDLFRFISLLRVIKYAYNEQCAVVPRDVLSSVKEHVHKDLDAMGIRQPIKTSLWHGLT